MFKCDYCQTVFTAKCNMLSHQKTAKYCLQRQGVANLDFSVTCQYCQKQYASQITLNEHHRTCQSKQHQEMRSHHQQLMDQKLSELEKIHEARIHVMEKIHEDEKRHYETRIQVMEKNHEDEKRHYEARIQVMENQISILTDKEHYFQSQLEKRIDDITDIARQTKTKTTNTNITINNTSLDLQDTSHIRSILDQYMDINVLALGQKGVARMLKDTLLTDEYGQKRYRCTDANRGNFEYIDPDGNLQRDPKAAKLTTALVQSEIRDLAYDRGDKFWKNEDGSTDMRKFDTMSEKVQEVATIQQDDTKFRTELSKLMS